MEVVTPDFVGRPGSRHGCDARDEGIVAFLLALDYAEDRPNAAIRSYRWHADVDRVLREVSDAYGQLMKFAAYHLGNMAGQGLADDDLPRTKQGLDSHWFQPVGRN